MSYKYCLVDSNKKFIKSYSENEISEEDKKYTIFCIPPQLNEGLIAFWDNDSWYVRRKKPSDDVNENDLNFQTVVENFKVNNSLVAQRSGSYVSTKNLIDGLEKEKLLYSETILYLHENSIEIPEIVRTHISNISEALNTYKKYTKLYTDLKYYDDVNDMDEVLEDLLTNKFESDLAIKNINT